MGGQMDGDSNWVRAIVIGLIVTVVGGYGVWAITEGRKPGISQEADALRAELAAANEKARVEAKRRLEQAERDAAAVEQRVRAASEQASKSAEAAAQEQIAKAQQAKEIAEAETKAAVGKAAKAEAQVAADAEILRDRLEAESLKSKQESAKERTSYCNTCCPQRNAHLRASAEEQRRFPQDGEGHDYNLVVSFCIDSCQAGRRTSTQAPQCM
jgi:FtsZ-interacting cell division protein ZipA